MGQLKRRADALEETLDDAHRAKQNVQQMHHDFVAGLINKYGKQAKDLTRLATAQSGASENVTRQCSAVGTEKGGSDLSQQNEMASLVYTAETVSDDISPRPPSEENVRR
jgi:hypothetical protein